MAWTRVYYFEGLRIRVISLNNYKVQLSNMKRKTDADGILFKCINERPVVVSMVDEAKIGKGNLSIIIGKVTSAPLAQS